MKIAKLNPNTIGEGLDELFQNKYGSHKNYDFFKGDIQKSLKFCTSNENVALYSIAGHEDGKMKAHVSLIIDKRLPKSEAFFGFLEFPKNDSVFRDLWNTLVLEAREKGISVLKGPVNGSIWHNYRILKEGDGSDFFKSEPICEPFYYSYLVSNRPSKEINYFSAYRKPFDIVLRFIDKKALEKMMNLGFSITEMGSVTADILQGIAVISRKVFSQSWGYTELTESEFMKLYSLDKMAAHLDSLYLLYKGASIIGFCSTSRENKETLICKTICILPEYQGLGLGNALAYKVHQDASNRGYNKMIYALVREGNNLKNFPKDEAVTFRKYTAFEFKI